MKNYNHHLINLGIDFINYQKPKNLIYAFVGGSVGREEADEFSDLDLNLYVSESNVDVSKNIKYNNQVIQLHIHTEMDISEIHDHPWDNRFLLEAKTIYDPNGILTELLRQATSYILSDEGRTYMRMQAKATINDRLNWLEQCIRSNEMIAAGIAIRSALIDSAFYYSYFVKGSLSTGGLLDTIRNIRQFKDIQKYISLKEYNANRIINYIKQYREYMRGIYGSNFSLDPIQDEIVFQKASRYINRGDQDNLFLQLPGEILWCYLSVSRGLSFDKHFTKLPVDLQHSLVNLGYMPYSLEQIEQIKGTAEGVLEGAEDAV